MTASSRASISSSFRPMPSTTQSRSTDTRLFVEPLLDAVGVQADTRLLDVACGPGYVSEAAAARGAESVGVDVAEAMIDLARRRLPELEFVGR
jgi:2-polyprenyl-3-methyl-5-hydroxy-6-metoxy-1,4-benzoquinol methylase